MKVLKDGIIGNIFMFIFNKNTFLFFIFVTGIIFIISMVNRFIYIDDAFFGEQAFWLARDGVVKTESLIDFLGTDKQLFSYHKLHILVGAILVKIFGWSVTPLRLASLIIYIVFIIVFVRYFKQEYLKNSSYKKQLLIALFFLIVNPLIVLYAFTFRPEIWVMFFGFLSFKLIDRNLHKDFPAKDEVLAGVFAGLAFLTHLNGLIFLVAGAILLLNRKKWNGFVWFSIAGGLTSLLYFVDLWQDGHFETWMFQLKNWPDNNATNYLSESVGDFIKNVFIKLSQEHQRFFWSPKVWGISSFFLLVLFAQFKFLLKNYSNLVIYTITLILTLNIAGSQIAERFLIYLFPYMALIISIGIVNLSEKKQNSTQKAIFITLFLLQIGTVGIRFENIFRRNSPHVLITERIFSNIPDKESLTLVPYNMVFNALDYYPLASFKAFEYEEVAMNQPFTQAVFFQRASELGVRTIVMPQPGLKNTDTGLSCFKEGIIIDSSFYYQHYRDDKCIILVKK